MVLLLLQVQVLGLVLVLLVLLCLSWYTCGPRVRPIVCSLTTFWKRAHGITN